MSKIRLHGSSSGYTEIAPVAASGNNTLTLPNDGTIISKDSNGAVGVTSVHTTNITATGIATITTAKIGAGVTITESGIEASGIGITVANINGGSIGGRRNIIINGAMKVAQRGTSSTAGGRKTLDRFQFNWFNGDQVAITQSQSTDAPPDFSKSFKLDVTTAETTLDANEYAWINYTIEAQDLQQLNYGSSDAKSVTLSFWVKSYQTGDFAVNLNKYPDNTNRSITSTYTVNQSATWEKKTITFVGDTGGGGIDDDNGAGIYMYFFVVAGSDYKGSSANTNQWADYTSAGWAHGQYVNLFSSTDNYFQITGVQLEVGSQATPFEYRSYGEELELCKRYCQLLTRGASSHYFGMGYYYNSTNIYLPIRFAPQMRATPSVVQNTGSGFYNFYREGTNDDFEGFGGFGWNEGTANAGVSGHIYVNTGTSGTSGTAGAFYASSTSCKVLLSAEL
jgi:hypothetical protein